MLGGSLLLRRSLLQRGRKRAEGMRNMSLMALMMIQLTLTSWLMRKRRRMPTKVLQIILKEMS